MPSCLLRGLRLGMTVFGRGCAGGRRTYCVNWQINFRRTLLLDYKTGRYLAVGYEEGGLRLGDSGMLICWGSWKSNPRDGRTVPRQTRLGILLGLQSVSKKSWMFMS